MNPQNEDKPRKHTKPKDDFFIKPNTSKAQSVKNKEKPDNLKQRRNDRPNLKSDTPKEKKPFNKKLWREMKYSKKAKLQQWEDRRRKTVLKEYYREMKNDKSEVRNHTAAVEGTKSARKTTAKKAHEEFLRIQEQKKEKKEEAIRKKQERIEAMKLYKQKKTEIYKKLSKKTKRGQPVMKGRMEILLDRIQNSLDT